MVAFKKAFLFGLKKGPFRRTLQTPCRLPGQRFCTVRRDVIIGFFGTQLGQLALAASGCVLSRTACRDQLQRPLHHEATHTAFPAMDAQRIKGTFNVTVIKFDADVPTELAVNKSHLPLGPCSFPRATHSSAGHGSFRATTRQ